MRNFSLIFLIIFFTINCTLNAQSDDKNKDLSNQKELLDSGIKKVKENNFEAALKDFDMAIELNPSSNLAHEILFNRAQLKRIELKKINSALEDYNLAIELNKSFVKAYFYRSVLYKRNFKNKSKALEDLKKSIEIRPLVCGSIGEQPFWIKYKDKQILPNATKIHKNGLYLPAHHNLTKDDVNYISDIILNLL